MKLSRSTCAWIQCENKCLSPDELISVEESGVDWDTGQFKQKLFLSPYQKNFLEKIRVDRMAGFTSLEKLTSFFIKNFLRYLEKNIFFVFRLLILRFQFFCFDP